MNDKLQQAIRAVKSGDKRRGYHLLIEVIRANPKGKSAENAWLWMAVIIDDPVKKRECLETVLTLNPNNKVAQQGLARLAAPVGLESLIETPVVQDIIPRQAETTPPRDITVGKKRNSGHRIVWLVLLASVAILCCIVLFLFAIGSNEESARTSSPTSYSVTFRVSGLDSQALVSYGDDVSSSHITVQLPWERTVSMDYGDTAALVASSSSNRLVRCEIWVDDKLRISNVSSTATYDMAICGFIVGRNVEINPTE